ncbi:Rrf2 family transcriptional regulator [cf. Phormidesmis sp. LEGE 11477]|uniref:RrF2 family transcriptional regulator n=1 Tax=cf. Phormidesmis sp. LEGE 11477 TaxID=1828680 RepID=UPI00188115E8|nr:Rrf2 family transcriptional regulator [cf. Phormidesmis sp. LEGE 11477]MBE9061926.1 Rrf2 family transcriptional regulator [cf. Phormidesmis sp. LEGE 11477]
MKLTTRGHYSVKAMLDLSLQPVGSLSSVRQIAERQQLPAPYLEKLLIELRRSHLINSVRGAQGGYRLAKPAAQISLGQILEAVGESASAMTAVTSAMTAGRSKSSTPLQAEDWVTSMLWNRLNQKIQEAFHSISLEDLYYDARSWQAAQGEGASFVV